MKHEIEDIEGYEGIGQCRVCKAAEGEIPKECPGVPMTSFQKNEVYNGNLEYVRGKWWVPNGKRVNFLDEALNSGDGTYKP